MIIKSDAERIVQEYLDTLSQNNIEEYDNRRVVLPERSKKYNDGWIIHFESEVFLHTGYISFAIVGNYPIYINDNGELFSTIRAKSSRELLPDLSRRL